MHDTITSHSWFETLLFSQATFIVHHPGITGEGSAEVVRGRPLLVGGHLQSAYGQDGRLGRVNDGCELCYTIHSQLGDAIIIIEAKIIVS